MYGAKRLRKRWKGNSEAYAPIILSNPRTQHLKEEEKNETRRL
jgi:hypothetical protein